jgi:hypothetical protein
MPQETQVATQAEARQYTPGQRRRTKDGKLWEFVEYDENSKGRWREVVEEGGDSGDGAPPRRPPPGEKVPLGFGRTMAQGATFGFSDELAGLVKGLTPGGPRGFKAGYKEGVEGEREKLHAYREQNPLAAIGAEALGGLATGFGLAGGARAVGARLLPKAVGLAGKAKTGLLGKVTPGAGRRAAQAQRAGLVSERGGGLVGRMAGGAGIGAAEGALYGVGVGEDSLKSRAVSGAVGAGVGAVAAPVMMGGVAALGAGRKFTKGLYRGHTGKIGDKSRQIKSDEMLAESFIRDAPEQKFARGQQWVEEMEGIVSTGNRTAPAAQKREAREALKDMAESGDAQNYAAIRGAAADAAEREAVPGSVPRILGDVTEDFAETTAQVAQQGGDEVVKLKGLLGTGSRAEPVAGSLGDLGKASHSTRRIGSAKKRLKDLEADRKAQAAQDYGNFYDLDAADWAKIVDDPTGLPLSPRNKKAAGLQAVISDLNAAILDQPATLDVLGEAFVSPSVATALKKAWRGGRGTRPKGARDLTLEQILKNPQSADARDIDTLYRGLKKAQEEAGGDLGNILGRFASELDNSVAKHSGVYRTARGNYRLKSRKMDAYENGTKNYTNQADLKDAHDNAWRVARDQGENLTDAHKNEIQKEFRQARIDTIADKASAMDDASGADYIEKQFRMLFDGPDAPFANAGGTTEGQLAVQERLLGRVRANLKSRSAQASTGKRVDAARGGGLLKETSDVPGAVQATAGLYGLAGQYGAMGRTSVASLIYGPGKQRKYAQALAKRLRQKESQGLLDMAETLKGTERRRLAGLLGERGMGAGGAAAVQGYPTADISAALLREERYR